MTEQDFHVGSSRGACAPRWHDFAAAAAPGPGALLALALDQIDYGVILLDDCHALRFANYRARLELDRRRLLQVVDGHLRACVPADRAALASALAASDRGLRRWLSLGEPGERIGVAVTPLDGGVADDAVVMLTLARPSLCEPLTISGFAQAHGLTAAEQRVLEALCGGEAPGTIALRLGVALSTVRTQVSSIRNKTHCHGIDDLLRKIARQPPLPCRLRMGLDGAHALAS